MRAFAPFREHSVEPSGSSLLITLAIFRALATECRRDVALISPSLIASVEATMAAVPKDLEVVARAASVVRCLKHPPFVRPFDMHPVHGVDNIHGRPPDWRR